MLHGSSTEALLVLMAKTDSQAVKCGIKKYITSYCEIKLKISGNDIKKMGLNPSPDYGKIMNKLLYIKMDKGLKTKKQELDELTKLLIKKRKYRKMSKLRMDRMNKLLREELSWIIQHKINSPEIHSPEIGIITITNIKASPDLRQAKVYVSFYRQ